MMKLNMTRCVAIAFAVGAMTTLGATSASAANYHCENESAPEDTSVGLVGVDLGTSGIPNGAWTPTVCVGNSGFGVFVDITGRKVTLMDCPNDDSCDPII